MSVQTVQVNDSTSSTDISSNAAAISAGTQDLAALVGILASDSVEPYAFNYSRGWLSSLVSTLSLLGVLGYIRGLVKLGLGRDKCIKAGFDTKSERSFFGVLDQDWLPPGTVHWVTYFRRRRYDDCVVWSINRRIRHTIDSMPILREAMALPEPTKPGMIINTCALEYKIKSFRSGYGHFVVPLLTAVTVGLSSFTITPLLDYSKAYAWSWYIATVGMFASLFLCFLTWSWVYAQEMLPHQQSDWADCSLQDLDHKKRSLERTDCFAFVQFGECFTTFELRAFKGTGRSILRAFSLAAAVVAVVSYVCQYIEIRDMTVRNASIWLAVQVFLALVRAGIWIWDPSFDDLQPGAEDAKTWQTEPSITFSEEKLLILRLKSLGPSVIDSPQALCQDSFTMPNWVLDALNLDAVGISKAFELAYSLYDEEPSGSDWEETIRVFRDVKRVWDLPLGFLDWWIESHLTLDFMPEKNLSFDPTGCRIIEDQNGRCHYHPYWSSVDRSVQLFGNSRRPSGILSTNICPYENDLSSAHRTTARVATPGSVFVNKPMSPLSGHSESAGSLRKLETGSGEHGSRIAQMWDDLFRVLRRERSIRMARRATFLSNPNEMGVYLAPPSHGPPGQHRQFPKHLN